MKIGEIKKFVKADKIVNNDEVTTYRFDFEIIERDRVGVTGIIAYKGVDLDGELLIILDSKEFDEVLKDQGFQIISKQIDWENAIAEITVSVMHRWKIVGYEDIFEIADDFVEDYLRKFGDTVVFAKADIELKKTKYQKHGGNLQ
jgi:hypothetical protein